jgi:hypothetical protein
VTAAPIVGENSIGIRLAWRWSRSEIYLLGGRKTPGLGAVPNEPTLGPIFDLSALYSGAISKLCAAGTVLPIRRAGADSYRCASCVSLQMVFGLGPGPGTR